MTNFNVIYQWAMEYAQLFDSEPPNKEALKWVLNVLPSGVFLGGQRHISTSDIKRIKQLIIEDVNEEDLKKKYKLALNWLCGYLHLISGWSVAPLQQKTFNDLNSSWMGTIYSYSHKAEILLQGYETLYSIELNERQTKPSFGFIALQIMLRVAPLPLSYLVHILKNPACLNATSTGATITVQHRISFDQDSHTGTDYHVDLITYKLLQHYFLNTHDSQSISEAKLLLEINFVLAKVSLNIVFSSAKEWLKTGQIAFYHRHNIPPILLQDLCDPQRHIRVSEVSKSHPSAQETDPYNHHPIAFNQSKCSTTSTTDWPDVVLVKKVLSRSLTTQKLKKWASEQSEPECNKNNILPWLFFKYIQYCIVFGGRRVKHLAPNTIATYAQIRSKLARAPLPLSVANDEEGLQLWAQSLLNDYLVNNSQPTTLLFFFYFMSWQPLTDHLDITHLTAKTAPQNVDAFCLSIDELDRALVTLSNPEHHAPQVQKIMASSALILSFFGMLRRSEILRLRCKDLINLNNDGRFLRLEITHTPSEKKSAHAQAKDKTKSGKSRTVYIFLPESYAAIIQHLLTLKSKADPDSKLIGFECEKEFQRTQNYILPITHVIKSLCGQHVRFHHLRHSGAHLTMLQLLHLAYPLSEHHWYYDAKTLTFLNSDFLALRFQYWLKGRDLIEVNPLSLFTLLLQEIGHVHYATTRLHYLHSIDWLGRVITLRAYDYSYQELRFLYDLSPSSNYIFELLKKWEVEKVGTKSQVNLTVKSAKLLHEKVLKQDITISQDPLSSFTTHPITTSFSASALPMHGYFDHLFAVYCTHQTVLDWTTLAHCWQALFNIKKPNLTKKTKLLILDCIKQLMSDIEFKQEKFKQEREHIKQQITQIERRLPHPKQKSKQHEKLKRELARLENAFYFPKEEYAQLNFSFTKHGAKECQAILSLPEMTLFSYSTHATLARNKNRGNYELWVNNVLPKNHNIQINTSRFEKSKLTLKFSLPFTARREFFNLLIRTLYEYLSEH